MPGVAALRVESRFPAKNAVFGLHERRKSQGRFWFEIQLSQFPCIPSTEGGDTSSAPGSEQTWRQGESVGTDSRRSPREELGKRDSYHMRRKPFEMDTVYVYSYSKRVLIFKEGITQPSLSWWLVKAEGVKVLPHPFFQELVQKESIGPSGGALSANGASWAQRSHEAGGPADWM